MWSLSGASKSTSTDDEETPLSAAYPDLKIEGSQHSMKTSSMKSVANRRSDTIPLINTKLWIRISLTLGGIWSAWTFLGRQVDSFASSSTRDFICARFGSLGPGCAQYTQLWDDVLDARTRPEEFSNDSRVLREIPQYVIDYAPLVHLYSEEQFWPCDIAEHLLHITPELNYTPIETQSQYSNLTNLDQLNEFDKGRYVYLTSNDNVEERPDWLGGQKNIPDEFSDDDEAEARKGKLRSRSRGGRSNAPAVLVTVNKGNGIVDAFWFYFYSYNLGNKVFNIRFGNHVGDWEHSLIRFQHGKPKVVFFSEHNFGSAYSYGAVEKIGKRVSSVPML